MLTLLILLRNVEPHKSCSEFHYFACDESNIMLLSAPYSHHATTRCSYSGATSRRVDLTRLYPSSFRRRFFNTTGATNNIPIIDKTTIIIPIPPLKLGPLNPKSDHVSGGSQMISSYPVGFRQFGPVQFVRHLHVCGLDLDRQTPLDSPPHDSGSASFVDAEGEHIPPPF